jgi:putative DNA primase/helicase
VRTEHTLTTDDAGADTVVAAGVEIALAYAARGWAIFPVHSLTNGVCTCGRDECESAGKHPRTKTGLKEATTDAEQIREWWSRWPGANVGLATGAVSGLLVLDVDVDSGGEESATTLEAEHRHLPATVTALTGGGGRHLLFRHPGEEVRNSAGRLGPGLDTRGDGGYVVAPPSLHASGRRYLWQAGKSPDEVALAETPVWLLRLLEPSPIERSERQPAQIGDGPIPEGARNQTLASIAGSLRWQGMEEGEILTALLEINARRCVPPLAETEVAQVAASIASYPRGRKRYNRTDLGNAERLVDRHGPELRFSPGPGWHLLAFYAFPADHRAKLRSTNPLERFNREIGRRTDVVGIFPNDRSLIRLAASVVIEQNDEWLVGRRYLSNHSLDAILNDYNKDNKRKEKPELSAA